MTSAASFQIDSAAFLRDIWQRKPQLFPASLASARDLLQKDALFHLAIEDFIYSRLVGCSPEQSDWHCEYGPFEDDQLKKLLDEDCWSLLVSQVDHHLASIRQLRETVAFLPRWRFDDVMVSYSSAGGGVGPHFDYYDVLLIQSSGEREWRIGQQCDDSTPLLEHDDLRLLEHFEQSAVYHVRPGDVLYIPPGRAHWGIASTSNCVTISIGFRAPSNAEALIGTSDILSQQLPEDTRFEDDVDAIEDDPWLIGEASVKQISRLLAKLSEAELRAASMRFLGQYATSPSAERDEEGAACGWDNSDFTNYLGRTDEIQLQHHPSSRFAYAIEADKAVLFVDGDAHLTTIQFARGICHARIACKQMGSEERDLLWRLIDNQQLNIVTAEA